MMFRQLDYFGIVVRSLCLTSLVTLRIAFGFTTVDAQPFAYVTKTARARGLGLLVAMVAALVGAVTPQPAIAQGRPDIIWMRGGHPVDVEAVAYSPNGTLVASGSELEIKLWRAPDGVLTRTLTGHVSVRGLAFSPDGQFLASAGYEWSFDANGQYSNTPSVRVWNVSDGSLAQTFSVPELVGVVSVAFSPDGRLIAAGGTHGLRVWRIASGVVVLGDDDNFGGGVAFSPDGQYVAAAGDRRCRCTSFGCPMGRRPW